METWPSLLKFSLQILWEDGTLKILTLLVLGLSHDSLEYSISAKESEITQVKVIQYKSYCSWEGHIWRGHNKWQVVRDLPKHNAAIPQTDAIFPQQLGNTLQEDKVMKCVFPFPCRKVNNQWNYNVCSMLGHAAQIFGISFECWNVPKDYRYIKGVAGYSRIHVHVSSMFACVIAVLKGPKT